MFNPKTEKIEKLSKIHPEVIKELVKILDRSTNIYLDYGNLHHWSKKLGWHIDQKRLKQFFDSFKTIKKIVMYNGTLIGNEFSENFINDSKKFGYIVITKPVKIMKIPVDVSGIPLNSPTVIENFIDKSLLRLLDLDTIEFLNGKLKEINNKGVIHIEKRKCNFDVEMGTDILLDCEHNNADTYILWTGDSDFADPIKKLVDKGKKVFIFATVRRVSVELSKTNVPIFEIKKIKDFICRKEEIAINIKNRT